MMTLGAPAPTLILPSGFPVGTSAPMHWACSMDAQMQLNCTAQPWFKRPLVAAGIGLVAGLILGRL